MRSKFSLELEGFAVGIYGSAAELLRAQDLSRFHCLVIDYNMPGMNGLDLVVRLRELQVSAPAILITSDPSKALVARADRASVRIVEKPLLGNTLLDRIHEAIAPKAAANGELTKCAHCSRTPCLPPRPCCWRPPARWPPRVRPQCTSAAKNS